MILNFIANALDSKMLLIEQDENEKGGHFFPIHKNFKLIATKNPNNNSYIRKREELPEKLLQQFNISHFPSLSKGELKEIASEIAKKNGYNNISITKRISDLHYEWINSEEAKNSPQCFTIRDLNTVIKSISKKNNPEYPYDSLIIILL